MARVGSKNELIKCEYCGEMYSVTYKHCPFCNEDGTGRWDDLENGTDFDLEDEYEDIPQNKGGKRLAGGRRGGGGGYRGPSIGRIITTVLSLALIIAAVCIVVSIVKSMLAEGPDDPKSTPAPAVTQTVKPQETPDPVETGAPGPEESAPAIPDPVESAPPIPTPAPSHAVGNPTSFTLNREDFTFDGPGQIFQMRAKFVPEGTNGTITWKSSDPNVASVSWNGVVTSVSKGTVTLTATVDGVGEQKCIVRCNFKDGSGETPAPSTPPSNTSTPSSTSTPDAGFTLNREDFTLKKDETFRLVVKGTSAGASWSSSDASVATVSADGTVTGVGKGTCKVTATVNGKSVKCIVRCSG